MEEVDLEVCRGRLWEGLSEKAAVVLPGARYTPGYPLLWFAREAVQQHGWTVLEVWDEWNGDEDPREWVATRAEAALSRAAGCALMIAKSLSTLATGLAAERSLPAVWLTPLLDRDDVVEGLRGRTAPALLVGGTADVTWRPSLAQELGEVLQVDRADHSLELPDDPIGSIEVLREITDRIGGFTARL
jgi:pimeloyl-ACP methyl ester carboxylesterase